MSKVALKKTVVAGKVDNNVVQLNTQSVSAYKLDDGVPMPTVRQSGILYPWSIMEVGQSFFVAGAKSNTWSTNCNKAGKKYDGKYASRSVVEDGVEGVRVWRMA